MSRQIHIKNFHRSHPALLLRRLRTLERTLRALHRAEHKRYSLSNQRFALIICETKKLRFAMRMSLFLHGRIGGVQPPDSKIFLPIRDNRNHAGNAGIIGQDIRHVKPIFFTESRNVRGLSHPDFEQGQPVGF